MRQARWVTAAAIVRDAVVLIRKDVKGIAKRCTGGHNARFRDSTFTGFGVEHTMANSVQARKRARQAASARLHNQSQRSEFRTAVKKVLKAVEAGDKTAAAEVLRAATSTIDRIADKGVFHKNKAARHKSRLSAAIKAMA